MSDEMEMEVGPLKAGQVEEFPEIFAVVEGTLTVSTTDDFVGLKALRGFEYLLSREFARQQPALSLLYDLEFSVLGSRRGSRRYDFKIVVKLKTRLKSELRKAGAVGLVSLVLGLPGAVLSTFQLVDYLFPPVQTQLNSDMPNAPATIELREVRPPDSREMLPPDGDFSL